MRRHVLLFLSFLCCTAAWAQDAPKLADQEGFERKVGEMLQVRSDAYRFAQDNGILGADLPVLTREQSNQLRKLAAAYLEARASLMPYALEANEFFRYGVPTLSQGRPTGMQPPPPRRRPSDNPQPHLSINAQDAAGQQAMLEIMRGLAAAMVLWDSYRIAVLPYERNSGLQYVLTYDVETEASLRTLATNYYSPDLRTRLVEATRFVDAYMEEKRIAQRPADGREAYLYALIQSTLWYGNIRDGNGIHAQESLRHAGEDLRLQRLSLQNALSYGISMGFGNMVGIVQTRRGYLSRMSADDTAKLAGQLRPLDILLEKTPFRLTDKMIPGYYGHVAIWLGSEDDLRSLGVWDRIPRAYQERIRNGGRIVEALRPGVTISTLPHFLNIDDLLVLRDRRDLGDEYRQQALMTAVAQVGKEYDFNFDVYTHKRIVCSELAYVVFPDVSWPLAQALGRYTISPDNVAQMAIEPTQVFEPVILYRDGTRVEQDLGEALAKLIDPKRIVRTSAAASPILDTPSGPSKTSMTGR